MTHLFQSWKDKQNDDMNEHIHTGKVYERVATESVVKKWIVFNLTRKNISFRVHNLGAGVVKITTDTSICPKCHGTGKI